MRLDYFLHLQRNDLHKLYDKEWLLSLIHIYITLNDSMLKIYKTQHEKILKIVDELFDKIGYERQSEVIKLFDLITQTAKEML